MERVRTRAVQPERDEEDEVSAERSDEVSVEELPRMPVLLPLYGRAVVTAFGGGDDLPDDEVVVHDVAFDPDHLAAYGRVSGFPLRDAVPSIYPHVVAFPLTVHLMARRSFPFPLPGLVHVAQGIEQHRALTLDDQPTFRARTADLRPHARGQQFDVLVDAEVDGEPVWRARSTYLRRGDGAGDARTETWEPLAGPPTATWRVAADTGRRYAAVSGDRNPIHLNRVTSRVGGFARPIAHGMWTMARGLAALDGRVPEHHAIEVTFRRPVELPTRVELRTRPTREGWLLDLRDARRGALHLTGRLSERI
jgi:acyl dehydratase